MSTVLEAELQRSAVRCQLKADLPSGGPFDAWIGHLYLISQKGLRQAPILRSTGRLRHSDKSARIAEIEPRRLRLLSTEISNGQSWSIEAEVQALLKQV